MYTYQRIRWYGVLLIGLGIPGTGFAECPGIDFENLAVGTAVTTQYAGVTFSVEPQSCQNNPKLYMRIVNPAGGTSSGTKGIQIDTGCPDFSTDYLKIEFDNLQREVSFTLGEATGVAGWDFTVRYYSDVGLLGTISCESGTGVYRYVHIGSSTNPAIIRRVEVEESISGFEVIDDLKFDVDTTAPIAMISAPAYEACACDSVLVTGLACDDDGEYTMDMLEYRSITAAEDDPWTLIDTASVPVCEDDYLYTWDTSDVAGGRYYLRLTVFNECGLSTTAVTVAYVDKQFDTLDVRYPASGSVVGGDNCVDGTVWDFQCFDHYTVSYRLFGSPSWLPVNPIIPTYLFTVITDPLAVWDTKGMGIPDGLHELKVEAEDDCGNTATEMWKINVDNTAPTTLITAPVACEVVGKTVKVIGTANDAHLDQWVLEYTGGDDHEWVAIANGDAPVVDDLLAEWDTSTLSTCAYVLRLRAWDTSVIGCMGPIRNESEYLVAVQAGGAADCTADVNGDGIVDPLDAGYVLARFGPCP